MTHDELLARISLEDKHLVSYEEFEKRNSALRAVVELSTQFIDTQDWPAEQVEWFYEGYNLALENILEAIEKELN